MLSSFFWGYITLQLVAGELGRRYGTKIFLVGGMLVNAIASTLVPLLAAAWGSYGVIVCRVIKGISQGFFYSSVYNLLGRWVPLSERSRLGTIALTGNDLLSSKHNTEICLYFRMRIWNCSLYVRCWLHLFNGLGLAGDILPNGLARCLLVGTMVSFWC